MTIRVLFHEYKITSGSPTLNTVSGLLLGTTLIGVGTLFTTCGIVAGDFIDIEDVGRYEIGSITDATHLEITGATFPGNFNTKKWYRDFTDWKLTEPSLTKKVESENPGDAGIVVFDGVGLEFRYAAVLGGVNNPVYDEFSANMDSAKRFVIVLKAAQELPVTGWAGEKIVFEGMVDFSTISYPTLYDDDGELINAISFEVIDKLSALALIKADDRQRGAWIDIWGRVPGESFGGSPYTDYNWITSDWLPDTSKANPFKGMEKIFLVQTWNETLGAVSRIHHDWNKNSEVVISTVTTPDTTHIRINTATSHGVTVGKIIYLHGISGSASTVNRSNLVVTNYVDGDTFDCYWANAGTESGTGGTMELMNDDDAVLKKGETFVVNMATDSTTAEKDEALSFFVADAGIIRLHTTGIYYDGHTTWIKVVPLVDEAIKNWPITSWLNMYYVESTYYNEVENYIDIEGAYSNYHGRSIIVNFDGIKILEALIRSRWDDITLENRLYDSSGVAITEYPLPTTYMSRLINELPMGHEPLEGLSFIAGAMEAYVWIDTGGDVIIQNKHSFTWSGWTFPPDPPWLDDKIVIDNDLLGPMTKHLFWDKLVDYVEIQLTSFVRSYDSEGDWTGGYLDGLGIANNAGAIKPRNKLTKGIVIHETDLNDEGYYVNDEGELTNQVPPTPSTMTEAQILNAFADVIAQNYLNFYGRRRLAYDVEYKKISWESLDWTVLDIFDFDSNDYFSVSFTYDFGESSLAFALVGITGTAYNTDTVIVGKQSDNYIAGGSDFSGVGGSYSGGGGGAVGNYWSGSPLYLDPYLGKQSLGLENVENVALSTWAGSTNLTTLGTITEGTWEATVIVGEFGGTGVASK